MYVKFINTDAGNATFRVRWMGADGNRQESNPTGLLMIDQNETLDLGNYAIPEGTSCWANAQIVAGVSHDSGDNFSFTKSADKSVTYQLSGTTGNPSFSMS